MTCRCGHVWDILPAHVIRVERTPAGTRLMVQCPACGRVETVTEPATVQE